MSYVVVDQRQPWIVEYFLLAPDAPWANRFIDPRHSAEIGRTGTLSAQTST